MFFSPLCVCLYMIKITPKAINGILRNFVCVGVEFVDYQKVPIHYVLVSEAVMVEYSK